MRESIKMDVRGSFLQRERAIGRDSASAFVEPDFLSAIWPSSGDCRTAPQPLLNELRKGKSQESLCMAVPQQSCIYEPSTEADEKSDDSNFEPPVKQGLFRDLCQTQLSLWTFTISTLLAYFWQKRVRVRSLLLAGAAVAATGVLSAILALVVFCAHLLNSDLVAVFGKYNFGRGNSDLARRHFVRRQSSTGSCRRSIPGSGTTTPHPEMKSQQARFWQKNVSLERTFIGSSRA